MADPTPPWESDVSLPPWESEKATKNSSKEASTDNKKPYPGEGFWHYQARGLVDDEMSPIKYATDVAKSFGGGVSDLADLFKGETWTGGSPRPEGAALQNKIIKEGFSSPKAREYVGAFNEAAAQNPAGKALGAIGKTLGAPVAPLISRAVNQAEKLGLPHEFSELGMNVMPLAMREGQGAIRKPVGSYEPPTPPPSPPSLLKGAGGKPLTIEPKAMDSARGILQTALKEDDINPLDIAQKLEEAKSTGLPITAADVIMKDMGGVQVHGKNLIGLLKGASNMPGPGASMAGEVAARGGNIRKRIGSALDTAFSSKGVYEVSDAALEKIKTETPKAYATAFEGGSIAPLEKQFEGELGGASAQKSFAQKKVNEANQKILQIEAQKQTNANVYVDNSLISAKRKAHEELHAAQKELETAQKKEGSAVEILRQAQLDAKNGVKGAVWSPRIQEMLGDDTIQNGIKKGLWIAKKEALANGEKFNPTEYGITGYDEGGNPIVSKVPNMRMLDAGKKGLDAIINENKNQLTKEVNETGRAVSLLKKAYLKEIDRLNPDYKKARESYGDQASVLEALNEGRKFTRMDKEEISRFMKDPDISKAEKAAFATGVRRKLQDILDEDPANPIRQIWKTGIRDKIESVFPNKQILQQFDKLMGYEQNMHRINGHLATGSHTNMLGNYQGVIKTPGKILKAITNPQGAAVDLGIDMMSKNLQKRSAKMSKDQASAITRYLTTNDPQVWYDLANRLQTAPVEATNP